MSITRDIRIVRPAGAGLETLAVLLACTVILVGAALVVVLRVLPSETASLREWQIDARLDLTAAEQGIHADLRVAADDILPALDAGTYPTPAELAQEALPPFVSDATTAARGGHAWSLIAGRDGFAGWFGHSASPDIAGSMLLRLALHDSIRPESDQAGASVWLNRSPSASIEGLADTALIAGGWKEVTSHFDASVTRGARP